ncbi:GAF domain-containing protein [Alloalcanivorax mobilis]|uniref:GAF domain-containing protein n=1 Tax=Alloalcanivorax mobilis TaxID=2019569 RepID=UPI001E567748|nr:GAF domain-containing protein [Alloalcanivorax mobilis]
MTDPLDMKQTVDAVRRALQVDVCSLYRAHARPGELEIVATSGLNQSVIGQRLGYHQGLTGKVARTGQPVVARVIQEHADYYHVAGSGEERFQSYLGIPLVEGDTLHGVLVIQTEQTRTFFHRHIQEVHSAGRQLLDDLIALAGESAPT